MPVLKIGVLATLAGIYVEGRGNIIRNNQVVDTGGTTYPTAYGIWVLGPGNRVINNDVYETKEQAGGNAYGIRDQTTQGTVIANNRVGNSAKVVGGGSYGIYVSGSSSSALVKDNTMSAMDYGIYYDGGSTGIYMNNLTSACTTAFTGGTPAGITNYH